VIVMPVTTPQIKVDAVRALGAEVVLHGDSYSDAYAHALKLEKARALTFVHPFDDPDVIAGQGTIGMEILRQHQGPIDAIFVAVGGGGLISGIAAYVKAVRPGDQDHRRRARRLRRDDALARRGPARALEHVGLFADGVAVKQVGKETFRLCRRYVDEMVLVDTDEICAAIKDVFEDTRARSSSRRRAGVAGAKATRERAALARARRWSPSLRRQHELRPAALRRRARRGRREARGDLRGDDPREPGSFREFCALSGAQRHRVQLPLSPTRARRTSSSASGARPRRDRPKLARSSARLPTLDLTDDEMAKLHVRHLVGGPRRWRPTSGSTGSSSPSGPAR
jgi:threonine dehydratase